MYIFMGSGLNTQGLGLGLDIKSSNFILVTELHPLLNQHKNSPELVYISGSLTSV